jgi:hypothetical protein
LLSGNFKDQNACFVLVKPISLRPLKRRANLEWLPSTPSDGRNRDKHLPYDDVDDFCDALLVTKLFRQVKGDGQLGMPAVNAKIEANVIADREAGCLEFIETVLAISYRQREIAQRPPDDRLRDNITVRLVVENSNGHGSTVAYS